MKKGKRFGLLKKIGFDLQRRSPEIMIGFGIAASVSAIVFAVRATPKAMRKIEEKKEELQVEKLTPKETIQAAWKCYIPAAAMETASIGCLICSNKISSKRNAALAAVYKMTESAFSEYKEKVIETLGEEKEHEIVDKISEDRVQRNPVCENQVIATGKGNTLCYDPLSKRYFYSDANEIKRAENELNKMMIQDILSYTSLNDFYSEIGLEETKLAENLGWNTDYGFIDIYFSSMITENNVPCLVVNHMMPPTYEYDRFR